MREVDAVVIGSGQGGVPLAEEWAGRGKSVAIFERGRLGGSCVNYGCTPSKAFLASAHAAGRARGAEALGVRCRVEVDFPRVMERVREIRDSFSEGIEQRLAEAGVELVRSEARFTPDGAVTDGNQTFRAPIVVINTGSSPAVPPVPGLDRVPMLTDRSFWDLDALPARALFLGGGYIGLELGQGLARLGSQVRIVESRNRVMATERDEVGAVLQEALERDGVRFHLGATAEKVEHEDGRYALHLKDGSVLEGDALVVATGRSPNTEALGATAAGIELDDQGFVRVDDRFRTTREGVYAIGEAAGQPAFTHVAWADHKRLLSSLDGGKRRAGDRVLAYAAFTDPQVGRAGLDLDQARDRGMEVREASLEVKNMARAIEWSHDLGFYQILVEANTGRIVGATLVGHEAAEVVHVFLDLIESEVGWERLEHAQHIHPTYAENLPSVARRFMDQP